MTEQNNVQENPQDKIAKTFDKNFSKLVALLGEKNLRKARVKNDEVGDLVEELVAESREAMLAEFKAKAKQIIQDKIKFDKEVAQARKDYDKVVSDKMKVFNESMVSLFNMVENIDSYVSEHYTLINQAKEYAEQKDNATQA